MYQKKVSFLLLNLNLRIKKSENLSTKSSLRSPIVKKSKVLLGTSQWTWASSFGKQFRYTGHYSGKVLRDKQNFNGRPRRPL